MRSLFLGLGLLLAVFLSPHRVEAQAIVLPCVPSGSSCIPVSAANPLPITGGGGIPASCVTANGVVFNNATACDSGFTYGGAAGSIATSRPFISSNSSASCSAVSIGYSNSGNNNVGLIVNGSQFFGCAAGSLIWATGSGIFQLGSAVRLDLGSGDVNISRQGVGVAQIGTTAANALGSLLLTGITASGTGVNFTGLATGTNADVLCLTAGGQVVIQAAASCTISTLTHKPDWAAYTGDALSVIHAMEVGTFHYDASMRSKDPNWASLQIGLNAENIARVLPEAAIYEEDMRTPKTYREQGVIALLVKAIQQQQIEIEELKRRLH